MFSAESVEGNVAVEGSVWMGDGQPAGVGEPVGRVEGREGIVVVGSSSGKSSSSGSKKSSAAGRMRWGPRVGVVTGISMRHGMDGVEHGWGSAGRSSALELGGLSVVDGEGEKRGGEGCCGEKGFWVSGIGEVGVAG